MALRGSSWENRIYIRGCAVACALGATQPALARCLRRIQSAPSQLRLAQSPERPVHFYAIPQSMAGASQRLYRLIDRVVDDALKDAGISQAERQTTGVFCGSTACDISDLEERYQQDLAQQAEPVPLYRSGFGVLSGYTAERFALGGREYSFNTACSSSANAFITAAQMIVSGKMDHAVVLGVEVFNYMSVLGFNSMMLLSPTLCRPFDRHRDGTVLGEAVGAVVLSGQKPQCSQYSAQDHPFYYAGGANLCDTKSVTSSNTDVVAEVIGEALRDAELTPGDLSTIKAHGTSTQNNDQAEGQAMMTVFGGNPPPFTSLKPYLGHTLGACGVAELVCLLAALKEGFVPVTPNFAEQDPEIGVSPLREPVDFHTGNVMLNYFGFGGNNTSLIVSNLP